jgi:hypothetical protein
MCLEIHGAVVEAAITSRKMTCSGCWSNNHPDPDAVHSRAIDERASPA